MHLKTHSPEGPTNRPSLISALFLSLFTACREPLVDNDGDGDNDGHGNPTVSTQACDAPAGYTSSDDDCDDANPTVYPEAVESDCTDPVDYNCDGSVGYADSDDDGTPACEDCDDTDAARSPSATELCNEIDDNCDDLIDNDAIGAPTFYADADNDGYGSADQVIVSCAAPDGFVADSSDCDDAADTVHPTAIERCDNTDDNCNGLVDEEATDAPLWYLDADQDGFGHPAITQKSCTQPAGFVDNTDDCDDLDAARFPGNSEVCDGIDNDCDDALPADETTVKYADLDGDGFGNPVFMSMSCEAPESYSSLSTDCDDADAARFPGNPEICDGVDNDCDDALPANETTVKYADLDGDGFGSLLISQMTCAAPPSYSDLFNDCNDLNPNQFPGNPEICDGVDNDCDRLVDPDRDVLGTTSDCAAQSCFDLNARRPGLSDGNYWIQPDGLAGFNAFCEMSTDGGGWTLVYAYGFTDYAAFNSSSNAITPRPSWPTSAADVPVSTTPPSSPDDHNALDFSLWPAIGVDFLATSTINDWVSCQPAGGSLSDGLGGPISCTNVKDVAPACSGVQPSDLTWFSTGPSLLTSDNLFYYWDGFTGNNWPTHDPCGLNTPNQLLNQPSPQGAIYLRCDPAAPDPYGDEIDANCDGADGIDADGDGYADQSTGGLDCDDTDPTVFPGQGCTLNSCADVLSAAPAAPSGVYPLTLTGRPNPTPTYCDMETDGGGWTLVWKHAYLEVGSPIPDMTFFSQTITPCDQTDVGWCNLPAKTRIGVSEMRVDARTNGQIVYDFKGDLNPLLDTDWTGGIMVNHLPLIDQCTNAGPRPEPENGAHAYPGITWDKWNDGNYTNNCDSDRYNGSPVDCRWENCGLPTSVSPSANHVQMTMHMWVR